HRLAIFPVTLPSSARCFAAVALSVGGTNAPSVPKLPTQTGARSPAVPALVCLVKHWLALASALATNCQPDLLTSFTQLARSVRVCGRASVVGPFVRAFTRAPVTFSCESMQLETTASSVLCAYEDARPRCTASVPQLFAILSRALSAVFWIVSMSSGIGQAPARCLRSQAERTFILVARNLDPSVAIVACHFAEPLAAAVIAPGTRAGHETAAWAAPDNTKLASTNRLPGRMVPLLARSSGGTGAYNEVTGGGARKLS